MSRKVSVPHTESPSTAPAGEDVTLLTLAGEKSEHAATQRPESNLNQTSSTEVARFC